MTQKRIERLFIGCVCAALTAACGAAEPQQSVLGTMPALDSADGGQAGASAVLLDPTGASVGRISFTPNGETTLVDIVASLPAADAGLHAIHIHANDNPDNEQGCISNLAEPPSAQFQSADGHFNPGGHAHGHHAGDLPAVFFSEAGEAAMRFLTDGFQVEDIVGTAVILHALSDNYGNIPVGEAPEQYTPNSDAATDLTVRTGNAGARIACGVVE